MLIFPAWTLFNIILYVVFTALTIVVVHSDYYGWLTLQYSKFANNDGLPSRAGMFVLYFLPIVTATIMAWSYLPSANSTQWVVYGAVVLHFAKRVLEALFLHNYSGKIAIQSMFMIAVLYSLIAGMICYVNAQPIPTMDIWLYLGIIIFIFGEGANFYHHKLLVDLRKNGTGYYIPHGGLFEHVTCPHYFFEVIAWLGILLLSRHLFALLALAGISAYLTQRSIKTRRWYQEKFPEYPKHRKYIVPFVF